jgi:hypothetical protein
MGLNIYAWLVNKINDEEFDTEELFSLWDKNRYAGDKQFAFADFEWKSIGLKGSKHPHYNFYEVSYRRPADLIKANDWVSEYIPLEHDKGRYLLLIRQMEDYPNLYLDFSY